MRRFLIAFVLVALCGLAFAPAAVASSTAAFLDQYILGPRGSVLTGDVLVENWRWYGVPVRTQLVILGAETSLGTRASGGRLVDLNNFGCIKASRNWQSTRWGEWADGTVEVAGKTWLTWPTMEIGAHAWGRYLKVGAGGYYRSVVFDESPNWRAYANVYYGRSVPGLEAYIDNLQRIDAHFTGIARAHGFVW